MHELPSGAKIADHLGVDGRSLARLAAGAYRSVRAHFAEQGVTFDSDGRPLLPEVIELEDAPMVHGEASRLAVDALKTLLPGAGFGGPWADDLVAEVLRDGLHSSLSCT